jgi:hypothetical protein
MIYFYCKICKKFAELKAVWINGADEIKIAGACKHCNYEERSDYPKSFPFSKIPESNIDYVDFDELGIDR